MKARHGLVAVTLAIASHAVPGAQTDQSGAMLAPILRTERAGAGVVRVVYDLRGVSGTTFAVSLEASDDGGQTFTVRPRALTGDVGARVSPGAEKAIVWDSTKDVDDLQVDRYVFRVRVSATGPNAAVGGTPASGGAAAPGGRGTAGAGPGGDMPPAARKGGLGKGAILGILGGAAAGVGAALAGGKTPAPAGTSSSSTTTTTTTVPATDVTGTWVRTFTFSDPPVSGSVATLTFALTQSGTAISGSVTITLGPPASGTDIRPVSGTVGTSSPRVMFDNPIRSQAFTDRFGQPYGLCSERYALDLSSDGARLTGTVTQFPGPGAFCPTVGGTAQVTLNRR